MRRVVLAVGAHFDDIEIGCIGTLLQHILIENDRVIFAVTNSDDNLAGPIFKRIEEQKLVMNYIGLNPETSLRTFKSSDSHEDIVGSLDRIEPDIIFAPYYRDSHQHHVRASKVAISLMRRRDTSSYFYSSGSSIDFHPNVYSQIDYSEKETILGFYKTQIQNDSINLDIIKTRSRYFGSLFSNTIAYAEGFIVNRERYMII